MPKGKRFLITRESLYKLHLEKLLTIYISKKTNRSKSPIASCNENFKFKLIMAVY